MAEYGLLWKIQDKVKIDGNVTLAGYEKTIGLHDFMYGTSAFKSSQAGAGVSVSMSGANLTMNAGAWTAEILEALYRTKNLGTTIIYQLQQAVDAKASAAPSVLQTITLENTGIVGFSTAFTGGGSDRTGHLTVEFTSFSQAYTKVGGGDALSSFIIKNVVAKAV